MAQNSTTLFEFWGNNAETFNGGLNSYNHIMYGGTGSWCKDLDTPFSRSSHPQLRSRPRLTLVLSCRSCEGGALPVIMSIAGPREPTTRTSECRV